MMSSERKRHFFGAPVWSGALLFLALVACAGVKGQPPAQTSPREDAAPPPMRYIPEELRNRLSTARDQKARTRLSIELADERLASAAAHGDADRFDAATLELGIYQALVQDAIDFLRRTNKRPSGKTRDLFKRIELALRAHVPRLETLRRGLPSQHAVHAQATLDFVRDARTIALESFFDDTVLPDRPSLQEKPPDGDRATGTTTAAPAAEKKPNQR